MEAAEFLSFHKICEEFSEVAGVEGGRDVTDQYKTIFRHNGFISEICNKYYSFDDDGINIYVVT